MTTVFLNVVFVKMRGLFNVRDREDWCTLVLGCGFLFGITIINKRGERDVAVSACHLTLC